MRGKKIFNSSNLVLSNFDIQQPLVIVESDAITQVIITPEDNNYNFEIVSLSNDDDWVNHARGSIKEKSELVNQENNLLPKFKQKCDREINRDRYYQELAQRGLCYGETFRAIAQLWSGDNTALAKIKLPSELLPVTDNYQLYPIVLDACLQAIGAAFPETELDTYLPVSLEQLSFNRQITKLYFGLLGICGIKFRQQ